MRDDGLGARKTCAGPREASLQRLLGRDWRSYSWIALALILLLSVDPEGVVHGIHVV